MAQRARPLWLSTTWKVWMSSRIGLWLSSSRSVSARVPTVEYARKERSSAKSSQAARNSALSCPRSEALRLRQAGSSLKKVNLTNVRSATTRRVMATALAAGALLCFSVAPALGRSVTVVVLPEGATVHGLTEAGLSPGVMSAGIGSVPAGQTYLDISQGNRIDESLYDRPLPPLRSIGARVPGWGEIVQRADGAPANIVPGLLASSVLSRGMRSVGGPATKSAALVAARRDGVVGRETGGTLTVVSAGLGVVAKLARSLPRDGLLIAFASPPPVKDRAIPIGIAGPAFGGNLISDSTRTDGYVLSTDVAPTILRLLGVPVPSQMDGEPIRSEGAVDPGAVEDLAARMSVIPDRRAPVVIASLIAWIAVAALAALVVPGARRAAPAWLALAFAYMPLTLLAGAALEPSAAGGGSAGRTSGRRRFAA